MLSQDGIIKTFPLFIVLTAVGIISFLLITSTAPFNGVFDILFPKPFSKAATPPITFPVAVGFWRFDEGSGTTALDSSGSSNSGTLINGPTWSSGKFNSALNFDGVNDYVSIPNSPILNLTGPLTLSAWVKLNEIGKQYWVVGKSVVNSRPGVYSLYVSSAGKACIQFYNGVFIINCGTTTLTLGSWHFLAGVYDGSNSRVYLDGQAEGSPTALTSYFTNTEPLGIGGLTDAQWLNGSIDEVRIYNYAQTPAQIVADMIPAPDCSLAPQGDIDCNGVINIFDYNILVGNFNKSGTGIQGDFDNNGKVDIFDYNTLVTNFGKHL